LETYEIWSEKSEVFIKYEAEVSSRVSGGERGVVDFGKLFTETSEEKFSLGGVKELRRLTDFFMPVHFKSSVTHHAISQQNRLFSGGSLSNALTTATRQTAVSSESLNLCSIYFRKH